MPDMDIDPVEPWGNEPEDDDEDNEDEEGTGREGEGEVETPILLGDNGAGVGDVVILDIPFAAPFAAPLEEGEVEEEGAKALCPL